MIEIALHIESDQPDTQLLIGLLLSQLFSSFVKLDMQANGVIKIIDKDGVTTSSRMVVNSQVVA